MRLVVLVSWLIGLFGIGSAQAAVQVAIDLTHQRMHVVSARGAYDWPISSARSGFYTPGGSFAPTHLERMHYSKKYHMSPMPHAIFFRGGYAIHGTYSTGSLGRPASHGCVRLSPGNASALYAMVKAEGARISIEGTPPASRPFAAAHEARRHASHATIARLAQARRHTGVEGVEDIDPPRRRAARRGFYGYERGYAYLPYPYSYGYRSSDSYAPYYPTPSRSRPALVPFPDE